MTEGEVRCSSASRAPKSVSPDTSTRSCSSATEHLVVLGLSQSQIEGVHHVMSRQAERDRQPRGAVLVEQKPHAVGCSGICRSDTESAANRSAAATSSGSSGGSSSTTSAGVIPFAIIPTTVATGIRKPRMHGTPPIWRGLIVIRSTRPDHVPRGWWGPTAGGPGERGDSVGPVGRDVGAADR